MLLLKFASWHNYTAFQSQLLSNDVRPLLHGWEVFAIIILLTYDILTHKSIHMVFLNFNDTNLVILHRLCNFHPGSLWRYMIYHALCHGIMWVQKRICHEWRHQHLVHDFPIKWCAPFSLSNSFWHNQSDLWKIKNLTANENQTIGGYVCRHGEQEARY